MPAFQLDFNVLGFSMVRITNHTDQSSGLRTHHCCCTAAARRGDLLANSSRKTWTDLSLISPHCVTSLLSI